MESERLLVSCPGDWGKPGEAVELQDRKVLVTGGGRGIGREIAARLSERGAVPLLVGRDERMLREAADALPGRSAVHAADLSDRAAVDRSIAWCRAEHPDLAGLVNNAAVQHEMDLVGGDADANVRDAREEIALDLDAAVSLAAGLLPLLRGRDAAFVVNVTTGLAFAPKEASPVYCAAKAGLHAFTQALRYQCERGAPHVRVSEAILPLVDTDMTRGRGRGKMAPDEVARVIVDGIERERSEIWAGKAKLLRVLRRVAPGLPERILRGGRAGTGA